MWAWVQCLVGTPGFADQFASDHSRGGLFGAVATFLNAVTGPGKAAVVNPKALYTTIRKTYASDRSIVAEEGETYRSHSLLVGLRVRVCTGMRSSVAGNSKMRTSFCTFRPVPTSYGE